VIEQSRSRAKSNFDYHVFMYEAEKVGISATGDEDRNELYPNSNSPENMGKSCLEWYYEFRQNPSAFLAEA
jgi:type I restriction enzyme M protein